MRRVRQKQTIIAVAMICTVMLSACSWRLSPYKVDVRQGNYETTQMVDKINIGMTKEQVRFALGTPLLMDVFHQDRWDYLYRFYPRSQPSYKEKIVEYTISVHFDEQGLVSKVDVSENLPKEQPPILIVLEPKQKPTDKEKEAAKAAEAAKSDGSEPDKPVQTETSQAVEATKPAQAAPKVDSLTPDKASEPVKTDSQDNK